MSLRRLQRLSGLTETVSDTPELNVEIEHRLDSLPAAMHTPVLDALDVLKLAGDGGLTLADWAASIRQVHGDNDMPMAEVLKTAVREFAFVVKKLAPRTYAWSVTASDGFDPAHLTAVSSQVNLTHQTLALMRSLPSFTASDLAQRLSASGDIAPDLATAFVAHLLQNFQSMLLKTGDRYRLKSEPAPTRAGTMQMFRDIVSKPGPVPD